MLTDFLKSLFETGKIKVEKELVDFQENDRAIAEEILLSYFNAYRQKFPNSTSLVFEKKSALWALSYLYKLCQTLLIREITEETIREYLPKYTFGRSRHEVLSVDLIFQSVPQIYGIAKELSPSDILIKEIKTLANTWSFTLFEIAETLQVDYIEQDELLLSIFSNRIIEKKHIKAVCSPIIKNEVLLQLGGYKDYFWKELNVIEDAK